MKQEPRAIRAGHAAQLLGLCAFAVGQPLLDLVGRYAEFLIVHRARAIDVIAIALVVLLGPALFLILVEGLAGVFSPRVARGVHLTLVGGLVAMIVLPPLHRALHLPGSAIIAIALVLGSIAAIAAARVALVRMLLAISALSVVAFAILFLARPSVRPILRPSSPSLEMSAPVDSDVPLAMMVFDALPLSSLLDRTGTIDSVRYPNFARLAAEGIWFRNTSTVSNHTLRAVPAMLTGMYPDDGSQPTLADHPRNLFTLLEASHRFTLSEPVTRLCPPRATVSEQKSFAARVGAIVGDLRWIYLHYLLPKDLTGSLPIVSQNWTGFDDFAQRDAETFEEKRTRELRRYFDTMEPTEGATFHFVHTVLPHAPFMHFPSGTMYSLTGREPSGQGDHNSVRDSDEVAAMHSYQRHLLELEYVDRVLGEFVRELEEAGRYDDALIVVSADHGVSFRTDTPGRKVTSGNAADLMLVPFLLKMPAGANAGTIEDRVVETIDILPTIAQAMGFELPWPVDGRSALDPAAPPREEMVVHANGRRMTFDPDRLLNQQRETVERKLAWFPDPDVGRLLHRASHARLLGESAHDLVGGTSAVILRHTSGETLEGVAGASGFVPAEVTGYVTRASRDRGPLFLAVAVDGVVQAVTAPYAVWHRAGIAPWSTLLPERVLPDGDHHVEVFVVEETDGELALLRPARESGYPSFVGMLLGRKRLPGIQEEGFRSARPSPGTNFRWTNGSAQLVVPLDAEPRPQTVRIALANTGPEGTKLTIRANGRVLFDDFVPSGGWSQTLGLADQGEPRLVLEIDSDRFRRHGPDDTSVLGVAIEGIWLGAGARR